MPPSTSDAVAEATPARLARGDYRHRHTIATRWRDNDVYGHVNNVVFYEWFDTAVNALMIDHGLDIHHGRVVAWVVSSACDYHAPVSFPDDVDVGVRIARLGTSSVQWELGVFAAGSDEACASGRFVHVFVDRETDTSVPVPDGLRAALEPLVAS